MKKTKGISLIVLIITIVVIIILATAIIVNLAQSNIINNANEAVVKQDFKTLQDELNMYVADKYAETLGEFDATTLNATTKEDVAKIIPSITKTKYADYVVIENGKIAILDTMPEPQKTWAMEALGITETTNTPIEPEEPTTPVVSVNTKVETANSTITGKNFAYSNPVIPVGFKAINTTDASWTDADSDGVVDDWNDGLVIQDDNLNEFVWVPCTTDVTNTTNIQYTKRFDEYSKNPAITSVSDDTDALPTVNETTINENTQISIYGGFYIGRYEAGIPANQTAINGASSSTSNKSGIPVVKQGATVWTFIDYTTANANAKSFINTTNVKSGLVTGTAWDTVCAWINSEKDSEENAIHDVTNSVSWGNYGNTTGNAQYDTDGTTKISGSKQTAGKSENWKAKNIYDIAGNTWEWTGEIYSSDRIIRGGYHLDNGLGCSASCRDDFDSSNNVVNVSFRLLLYVI